MYQVRDWLFIGKYAETHNLVLLKSYGITAMLQLAELVSQPGITTLYIPINDGEPLLDKAIEQGVGFILKEKAAGGAILSACGAGISRSSTFALGALMEVESLSLWDAYRAILAKHPDAFPHPALLRSLARYYDEDVPSEEVDLWHHMLDIQIQAKKKG